MKKGLMNEFLHEAEGTRKLLNAIPDSVLGYRPQPQLWSVAQLASHIAEIYNWYDATLNHDEFDFGTYRYDKGDISSAKTIVDKFEENVKKAQAALEKSDESTYLNGWKATMDGNTIIPEMARIAAIRGFLYNHLYHHRGELVAHLRTNGLPVPGLYGPTYEQSHGA